MYSVCMHVPMHVCIVYACIKYCTRVPMLTRVGAYLGKLADLALERFSEED